MVWCAGEVVAVVVDGNGVGRKMRVGVPTIGDRREEAAVEDRAFGATRGKNPMHRVPYQGWCQRRVRPQVLGMKE